MTEFQRSFPLAALWGPGDKASADMMSLEASEHLWNARVDPRRRTYSAGLYTHVLDRYGIVYDQQTSTHHGRRVFIVAMREGDFSQVLVNRP